MANAQQFDPDAYLAQKTAVPAQAAQGFDPDAYLAQKNAAVPINNSGNFISNSDFVKNHAGLIKGGLEALPAAGGIGGAAIGGLGGTALEPIGGTVAGGIAGAGLGTGLGKSLENLGKKYILNEEISPEQNAKDVAMSVPFGATAEAGGQILGAGMKAAAESPLTQKAAGILGKGASKVGELLTGVPEQEIRTYANNADEIKAMAKATDNSTAEAADQMRSKFSDSINQTRQKLNNQISTTLQNSKSSIDSKPILDALEQQKAKLNGNLYPEQVDQISDLQNKVKKLADDNGLINAKDANDLKGYFQGEATKAYRNPGQIFTLGSESAKAAKSGAAVTRGLLNEAEPAIADANNQLSNLHNIEDNMNSNLLAEGKPEAGLISAGSGGNPRNAKALEQLGDATGTDMLSDAQKLSAMRTFGSPKLMAADNTGKAVGRLGIGAGAGYLIGNVPGAVVGSALTSPMALRSAVDAGQITGKALQEIASTGAGRQLIMRAGLLQSPNMQGNNQNVSPQDRLSNK